MFQGLRTVIYGAPDLAATKAWYSDILGFAPYFDEPFYVGYNVGGYELGLDPGSPVGTGKLSGTQAYWGVENIETAFAGLLEKGAVSLSGPQDVGDGIKVALVSDPFGNVFGIIENPHFKLPE
jgi:catechol 2,3-dioxygenase-like lactoylglutathione lyase family enzyme